MRSSELDAIPGVVHAFTVRSADEKMFSIDSNKLDTKQSEKELTNAAGFSDWLSFSPRQVHSNIVHNVDNRASSQQRPEGDAAFTSMKGVALKIATADCVPILIADSRSLVVGAVHAGWRGTLDGVTRRTVDRMIGESGLDPLQLCAVIGPHIGVCCMEVGEEVYRRFSKAAIFERRAEWDKPHLNLAKANQSQLLEAGLHSEKVIISPFCSKCRSDLFYSYRRDGDKAGRMFSMIGINRI